MAQYSEPIIIDEDAATARGNSTGGWQTQAVAAGYNGDRMYNSNFNSPALISYREYAFTGLTTGRYQIYACWASTGTAEFNAGKIRVNHGINSEHVSASTTYDVSYVSASSGQTFNSKSFQLLGEVYFEGTTLLIDWGNADAKYPMVDALAIREVESETFSETATGGATLGGLATTSFNYSVTPSGGATVGGSAIVEAVLDPDLYEETGSGGVTCGGSAVVKLTKAPVVCQLPCKVRGNKQNVCAKEVAPRAKRINDGKPSTSAIVPAIIVCQYDV